MAETDNEADRPKVLIVDDVRANLVAFKAVLSKLPVEPVTASSGHEALALLLRHEFAAILLDVQMPEMDGYETARLIGDHASEHPVPIIFITAGDRSEAREFAGYETGAIDYLFKPVDDRLLVSKVRVLVELFEHRRRLQESARSLSQLNSQLSSLLRGVNEGIVGLTRDGRIDFVNPSACRLLGAAPAGLWRRPIVDRFSAELRLRVGEDFAASPMARRASDDGVYRESEARFVTVGNDYVPVQFSLSAIESAGEPTSGSSYVLVFQDISDQLRVQAMLRQQAEHDELTGLPNRLVFRRTLDECVSDKRRRDRGFCLLYLDLDNFRPVNDEHGHDAGDALLRNLSWQMSRALRQDDLLARIGGDEFVVVLRDTEALDEACRVAAKLVDAVALPFALDGVELSVGVSIGVARYPDHGGDAEELIRSADAAMYAAKADSEQSVVVASEC